MEKGRTQSWHFWSNFDTSFPPEDGENNKKKYISSNVENLQSLSYPNMSLSPLSFFGKTRFLSAVFGIFLLENRVRSKVKGKGSKFDKYYFIYTIPGQLPVTKIWFKYFPVLRLKITRDISKKF